MKLDIVITFNDIKPMTLKEDQKIGFKQKYYNGQPLTYIDQLMVLTNSLKKNLKKYEYSIFALHSKDIDPIKKEKLEDLHINVIHKNKSFHKTRHKNRITAYDTDFCKGTHSLILDTDMICFKDFPDFNKNKDIQVMHGKTILLDQNLCRYFCKKYGIKNVDYNTFVNDPFKEYHVGNKKKFFTANFNNGCILIKNDFKKEYIKILKHISVDILNDKTLPKNIRWASDQIAMSLATIKCENWGILPKGFNYLSSEQNLNFNDICLYHYLGKDLNNTNLHTKYKSYFDFIKQ